MVLKGSGHNYSCLKIRLHWQQEKLITSIAVIYIFYFNMVMVLWDRGKCSHFISMLVCQAIQQECRCLKIGCIQHAILIDHNAFLFVNNHNVKF